MGWLGIQGAILWLRGAQENGKWQMANGTLGLWFAASGTSLWGTIKRMTRLEALEKSEAVVGAILWLRGAQEKGKWQMANGTLGLWFAASGTSLWGTIKRMTRLEALEKSEAV